MVNFIYILFLFVFSSTVFGGEASSRVNLSEGTLDDQFVLSVEVEGSAISTPQVPDSFQGMTFQSMGRSSSYSNINGVSKNLVTYNYQISFEKAGTYTVPSISVKVDSALQKTMPIKLKVLAPSNAIADDSGKKLPPIYIERSFDKKEVYLGDYLVSKVKIFARIPLRTSDYKYVESPGFQTKEIKGARTSSKVIKGHTYNIYEVSAILIPLKVGSFSVAPYKLTVVMPRKPQKKRRRDAFDDFFDDRMMGDFFGRRGAQKVISSNRIDVKVMDLPKTNQPADFSGIVGDDLKLSLKTPNGPLKTGENVNVDVELFGDVRLGGISLSGVKLDPSFKVYPSEGSGEDKYHHDGVRGKRVYSYGIVPTKPGKINMGSVQLSYFNSKTKSYKRIKKPLGELNVTGEDLSETSTSSSVATDQDASPQVPSVKAPSDFQSLSSSELSKIESHKDSWLSFKGWLPFAAFGLPLFIFFLFGANYWIPAMKKKFFQSDDTHRQWKKFDEGWKNANKSREPKLFYQLATEFISNSSLENLQTKNYTELQRYFSKIGFDSGETLVHQLRKLDKMIYGQGSAQSLDQITNSLYSQLKKLNSHDKKGY